MQSKKSRSSVLKLPVVRTREASPLVSQHTLVLITMIILLFKSAEWPLCLLLCVAWLCLKCRSALFCSHKDDHDRRRTSAFHVNVFAYQLLLSVKNWVGVGGCASACQIIYRIGITALAAVLTSTVLSDGVHLRPGTSPYLRSTSQARRQARASQRVSEHSKLNFLSRG